MRPGLCVIHRQTQSQRSILACSGIPQSHIHGLRCRCTGTKRTTLHEIYGVSECIQIIIAGDMVIPSLSGSDRFTLKLTSSQGPCL
jgi:hypothetical protein